MRNHSSKNIVGFTGAKGRVDTTLMIVATLLLGFTSAAVAEPPLNDHQTNATIIEGIPYTNTIDTIEATKVLEDPICISEADSDQTVWYSYTPDETTFINANTIGSKYDTILSAYEVGLEELVPIACHDDIDFDNKQSRIRFEAQAGVTYLFMIASYYSDLGGDMDESGVMTFNLIPEVSIDLALDSRSTVNPRTGTVTLRGTVTCTGPADVYIDYASLKQRAGRIFLESINYVFYHISCDGTTPWSLEMTAYNGLFAGGRADAHVSAVDYEHESYDSVSASVQLIGSRR